jgi:hypothetical protein
MVNLPPRGSACHGGSGLEISPIWRLKTKEEELDLLYPLARRIRQAEKESDLSEIENQIDVRGCRRSGP